MTRATTHVMLIAAVLLAPNGQENLFVWQETALDPIGAEISFASHHIYDTTIQHDT
jgi:hypothetical protein